MGSSSTAVLFLLVFSPLCLSVVTGAGKPHGGRSNKGLHSFFGARKEKLSHLHFYFHDILSGRNPSAVPIISNKTTMGFGSTFMIDDPLTEGPEPTSKLVGRAQGFYSLASQHDLGLLMVMNFAFVSGKYNGSSLSIMGRNAILSDVREMPVIGGTGLFRWARGYAQAHTVWIDPPTGDAVVEYHVHVLHY
ncbi:dirigent protein 22-like [Aristolochia californica]|uniref:dirigent protein 22-like n=1 Tax=Aristolochia californica TaxID=171875 RepID=UPI0035DA07D6